METLNLNNNQLTNLPDGVFDKMENLDDLGLYVNLLTELPEGIFDKNESIEDLNLSWNHLTEETAPPERFRPLVSLQDLYIRGNRFSTNHLGNLAQDWYATNSALGRVLYIFFSEQ